MNLMMINALTYLKKRKPNQTKK